MTPIDLTLRESMVFYVLVGQSLKIKWNRRNFARLGWSIKVDINITGKE